MTKISDRSKLEYLKEKIGRYISYLKKQTSCLENDLKLDYLYGQLSAYEEMLKTFEDME